MIGDLVTQETGIFDWIMPDLQVTLREQVPKTTGVARMQQEAPKTLKTGNMIIPLVWNSDTPTTTSHKFPERSILHPNGPLCSFNVQ
jgi:hypothetical protein